MSFSYNPFKHYDIIETNVRDYKWYCHSCGAHSENSYTEHTQLNIIIEDYFRHIKVSHDIESEDVEHWSVT